MHFFKIWSLRQRDSINVSLNNSTLTQDIVKKSLKRKWCSTNKKGNSQKKIRCTVSSSKGKNYIIEKLKKQKTLLLLNKAVRFELVRRDYLKDRKTSSKIDVFEKCYMMDKCIDDCCLLIGVGSEYCTNYDLLIHFKYV